MLLLRQVRSSASRRAFSAAAQGSRVLVWGNGDTGQLGLGPLKMEGMGFKHYNGEGPTSARCRDDPLCSPLGPPPPHYLVLVAAELVPKELAFPLAAGETIVDVSGGQDHSLAVSSAGHVFAWGSGKNGKLGLQDKDIKDEMALTPTLVTALQGVEVAAVSCGESHSVVLDKAGRVYTWGFGGSWFSGGGLLGHNSNDEEAKPRLVESLVAEGVQVKAVTAGELHTAVLTTDGEVMTCGAGEYGRLGHGGSSDYQIFTPIEYIAEEVGHRLGRCRVRK